MSYDTLALLGHINSFQMYSKIKWSLRDFRVLVLEGLKQQENLHNYKYLHSPKYF